MKKKLLLLGLLALNSFASDCKQDNLSKEETIECNQIARSTGEYAATYHKKTIFPNNSIRFKIESPKWL